MNKEFMFEKSLAYNEKLKQYLPYGNHYNFRYLGKNRECHFVKGYKSRLIDLDGNEILDLNCKFGANILGHCNERFSNALKDAIDTLIATNLSDLDYEVCQKLCYCIPSAENVRFSLSGTEAIQNALRLARAYTGKNRFLRFTGNYHGNADNILGGVVENNDYPIPVDRQEGNATKGRAIDCLESQSFVISWNDIDILRECIEKYHSEIAAVITEPISINGGGVFPKKGYLEEMKKLCLQYNIVLIFDEVITGFRVGLGGAQRELGVLPDITILGKALGGGIPISAIVGKRSIMELYDSLEVTHGGTFNGYRLGMVAVSSVIDILSDSNELAYSNMNKCCITMRDIVKIMADKYDLAILLKGPDSCFVLSYYDEKKSLTRNMLYQTIITDEIFKYGVYLSNSNRFYGNISLNDSDVELFEERIDNAFQAAAKKIHGSSFCVK